MSLKKTALSLFVIAASGAYVWNQSGSGPAGDPLGAALIGGGAPDSDLMHPATVTGKALQSTPPPRLPPVRTVLPALPAPSKADREAAQHPPHNITGLHVPSGAPPTAQPASAPIPRLRPLYRELPADRLVTRAAMTLASGSSYIDGNYTGPAVDAYYGLIQIQAIVRNGQIAALKVLQYPSDRRTSIAINRQALPMLRDEVVSAQTAHVDIISGATLTSEAFIRSLDGALQQANGP